MPTAFSAPTQGFTQSVPHHQPTWADAKYAKSPWWNHEWNGVSSLPRANTSRGSCQWHFACKVFFAKQSKKIWRMWVLSVHIATQYAQWLCGTIRKVSHANWTWTTLETYQLLRIYVIDDWLALGSDIQIALLQGRNIYWISFSVKLTKSLSLSNIVRYLFLYMRCKCQFKTILFKMSMTS